MAVNLARSFKLWHKDSDIKFAIATDKAQLIPPDLSDIQIIELQPNQYGQGFSPKLHLDEISPVDKTLFIDADCLCYGSLEPVFDKFAEHSVSVIGDIISQGEFFGDVARICEQFQVESLPRFVGGIYYFDNGEISKKVFDTARSLEQKYDQIGLVRLRGHANEEPLMAIAMALHGQSPIIDDGSIKADRMSYQPKIISDVINGKAKMWNQADEFPTWVNLTKAEPLIVHFNGHYINYEPYNSEVIRLKKVVVDGWLDIFARIYTLLLITFPETIILYLKNVLRPIFRRLFGTRKITQGVR
jgi:hypothetical protein